MEYNKKQKLDSDDEYMNDNIDDNSDNKLDDKMFKLLDTITRDPHEKTIYFVHGDEEESDRFLDNLITIAGHELQFVPSSLIKGGEGTFPLYNIEHAKYLVVRGDNIDKEYGNVIGVTEYDDIDKGFLKSLSGGDHHYCKFSHKVIKPGIIKVFIFCDNDPSDYLEWMDDVGFIHRVRVIKDGFLTKVNSMYYKSKQMGELLQKIYNMGDRDECSYKHILHGLTALYWLGSWKKLKDYETPGYNCSQEEVDPYWDDITKIFEKIGQKKFKKIVKKYDYRCDYRMDLFFNK